MGTVVVDFTDVEERKFELLPRGQYLVRVEEAEERPSQSSEYPYLNLTHEVVDGDFAGRKLWDICSYSPGALFKLKGFLRATGSYSEEELSGQFEFDPEDLIGAEVVAHVKVQPATEEYPAKNAVSKYSPA